MPPPPEPGSGPVPRVGPVVVMGVSGSGKTRVGHLLARRLGVPFVDGDDLHPPENVALMAAGVPLTDADRGPWLAAVGDWLAEHAAPGGVAACSALRRAYRDRLRAAAPEAAFVHLHGDEDLLRRRMTGRSAAGGGHFMPVALLSSQLQTLEPLGADERGTTLDVAGAPEAVAEAALRWLAAAG